MYCLGIATGIQVEGVERDDYVRIPENTDQYGRIHSQLNNVTRWHRGAIRDACEDIEASFEGKFAPCRYPHPSAFEDDRRCNGTVSLEIDYERFNARIVCSGCHRRESVVDGSDLTLLYSFEEFQDMIRSSEALHRFLPCDSE